PCIAARLPVNLPPSHRFDKAAPMRHTKAVCLDLDDTLWEIAPVLRRAEKGFHDWLAARYPRAAGLETVAGLRARRELITERLPELAHDVSALRRELYRQLAED